MADLAVMSDVRADHEQTIVAYPCYHTAAFGAGVHRHVFSDRVVASDHELRLLTPIF
jgi:hypothetical protein